MSEVTEQDLQEYRDEAESAPDAPLSRHATRPGEGRAKVLSVRLSTEEFDELNRWAAALEIPASALVRSWVLDHLRAGSDSPVRTVERIAQELDQLRRQLAA